MEHKNPIISWSFFITLLCIHFMIDFVKAFEVHSKAYMIDAAIQNRSILEQGGIGNDACAGILGPNWQNVAKQNSTACPNLVVWVPKKPGFTEFVKVNEAFEVEGGLSIAIFCHALQLLPFNIQPIFIPFTCEAVAGDITIRLNRTQYVQFTTPYLSSEVYMLVHGAQDWNQTLLTFIKPFTWRLWITIIGACIFIGVAIAILEYRVGNPRFAIPFYQKLIMVIWFPISTFFFHEGKILNKCSKVVLIMWLSMIFIVIQIFTAMLSSWLTLNQLHPRLPSSLDNVGYQDGTYLKDFITQNHNQYRIGNNPVPLKGIEDFEKALSNGSVNVVLDELPYVELFLAKYGSDYMKFGPIERASGLAFAFPHGSRLVDDFSRAIINVTENDLVMKLMEKYLGIYTAYKSEPNQPLPKSLGVQSFLGLFIFIGSVTLAAIILSEISLWSRNNKTIPISTVASVHL
ncbi:Extracellular solute-binding protein, family 3 [Cynara cardunculus var. scolymus]|uniref:Extracellular solute-binding protein, family 3 n=1 Tax=Cynara cardunculus var. scolymus TaxID=59895 RepID=A0A103Y2K6_CYNCS|nr:Extracellular solute-binding protein, family 3 [Cynara cardunculus var. scolymus]